MTEKEVRIEATLSEDDFVRFQREFMKHGWRRFLLPGLFAMVALSVAPTLLGAWRTGNQLAMQSSAVALAVLAVAVMLVAPLGMRYGFRRLYRGQPGLGAAQTYTISEAGVAVASSFGKGESFWPAFTELLELRSFYMLRFGPQLGYVIPKRAFARPADEEHFRSFVGRMVSGAKAGAPRA